MTVRWREDQDTDRDPGPGDLLVLGVALLVIAGLVFLLAGGWPT